jgi:hypothetical protein
VVLLGALSAFAGDPARDWGTLYDARLVEVSDGTPDVAAELYAELLEDRPPSDPLFTSASFWLGRSRLALEQLDAAVEALSVAATDPQLRDAAVNLLEEAELRAHPLTALPVLWDFESAGFPAVRGARDGGRGEVGVRRVGERVVLSWGTTVRPGEPDRLSLRFADDVSVRELRFSVRAVEFPAVIHVVAIDADGQHWESEDRWLGNEAWTDEVLTSSQFRPLLGPSPARLGHISELQIEDLTGERTSARGENTLLLDDVLVR